MRRLGVLAVIALLSTGLSDPVHAQTDAVVGDSGPASAEFEATDGACGFGNFTDDTYEATLGEDERGVYIDFFQGSTEDSGRFRSDAEGNITFETAGGEEYFDIDVQGDSLFTVYRYTIGDCTQEWISTVHLPEGFVEALIAGNAAPPEPEEPVTEEPVTEEPVVEEPVTEEPVTEEPVVEEPETEEPETEEPETEEPETEEAETEETEPRVTDDGGGIDWAILGLVVLLLLLFLALLWAALRARGRRLYRFDRGDGGVIIKENEPEAPDAEIDSGPPAVIVDDGESVSDPPPPPPPPVGDCVPEREEFMLAQEAKDAAFAAGEQADRELAEARENYGRTEATTRNPLGAEPPEPDVDPTASESEQARQLRVHELNVAQWQELEDQATQAKGELAAAKAVFDKARADSAEAWQDFQAMRRRLEAARVALNNCDGSAGPADDDDEPAGDESGGGESGGGTETGGGTQTGGDSPGILTEPTDTEPPAEEEGCIDGAEKDGKVVSSTDFTVLGGDITVEIGTSAWAQSGRTFDAAGFADLDTGTVEELSAGIEQERRKVRIAVRIPTKIVTVKCIQVLECDDNQWVDSGDTRREVTETQGGDIQVLPTGAAGGLAMSKDKRDAGRMVVKAQHELEILQENQEAADDCDCD